MIARKIFWRVNALAFLLALLAAPLSAGILQTGNVSPNVNTWTNSTTGYIGDSSDGSVSVGAGSLLASNAANLGHQSGATGMVTVSGAGSKWTNIDAITVGSSGHGVLIVEAGGQVSNSSTGSLGVFSGSIGTVTVTGAGSAWSNSGRLAVGNVGTGTLTIEDGGQVSNSFTGSLGGFSGSKGTVTVTGAGSTWTNNGQLIVGDAGNGTLAIEAGGRVNNSFAAYSGNSPSSTGNVTVSGAGSMWTNSGMLRVGNQGNGTLTVQAGGLVSNGNGYIGYLPGSTGTAIVTGADSKWINMGELEVGTAGSLTVSEGGEVFASTLLASLNSLSGNGAITVTNGGILDADLVFNAAHGNLTSLTFGTGGILTVQAVGADLGAGYLQSGSLTISEGVNISSRSGYLGDHTGSSGTATVTGENSKWTNSRNHYVGYQGHGSLTIEAGGQVSNTIGYVGYLNGSLGTAIVTGAGSKWTNSQMLYVGNQGHGTLTVDAGGQVSNATGLIGYDNGKTGIVTVSGAGSKWTNSGHLRVGEYGSGMLTIDDGALVSVKGTLRIDFSSLGDSFINMATGGMLALYGNADDSLSQFFGLVQGTDAIRYWDALLANWAPLTAATFGVDYTLEYLTTGDLAGYTLLTVGRVGDFDNDGDVDGRDFLIWQRNTSVGNLSDWQNNYGFGSLTAAGVAVPEPRSLMLISIGMIAFGRRATRFPI